MQTNKDANGKYDISSSRSCSWKGKGMSRKYFAIIKSKMQNTTGNSKIPKFIKIDSELTDQQHAQLHMASTSQ